MQVIPDSSLHPGQAKPAVIVLCCSCPRITFIPLRVGRGGVTSMVKALKAEGYVHTSLGYCCAACMMKEGETKTA